MVIPSPLAALNILYEGNQLNTYCHFVGGMAWLLSAFSINNKFVLQGRLYYLEWSYGETQEERAQKRARQTAKKAKEEVKTAS